MLPSSQVNTNPFEIVSRDPSRSTTPAPSPSGSSPTLSQENTTTPPSVDPPTSTSSQLPDQLSAASRPPSRSLSATFVSSPLNPHSAVAPYPFSRPRRHSRGTVPIARIDRIASEDSQVLGSQLSSSQRGSMILWGLATAADNQGVLLPPPPLTPDQRASFITTGSRDSMWTLSSDSKFPSATIRGGLVPYAWDPSADNQDDVEEDDSLHAPDDSPDKPFSLLNPRSISNLGVLGILVGCLLCLFIALPVVTYVQNSSHNLFIEESGGNVIDAAQNDIDIPPRNEPMARAIHHPRTNY